MNRHPLLRLRFAVRPSWAANPARLLNLTALTALNLYIPSIIRDVIDEGLLRAETGFLVRSLPCWGWGCSPPP